MREETFHLYGIRITCTGDVEKARTLAPHARRLMPQIKTLGVPMHTLRDPDGSYVQLLHQAGMDFARIHVPVSKESQPKVKEEFISRYFPAWYAYTSDREHVGYVIARGEGWQGPYEFIPREAEELRDDWETPLDGKIPSFEMGQWTEWWGHELWNGDDSRPFEWDDFLTPKLLAVQSYPGTEKMLWDIAPSGARNRFFQCAVSEWVYEMTADSWIEDIIDTFTGEIKMQPGGSYTYTITGTQTGTQENKFKLTFGSAGEQAAFEDDICGIWDSGSLKPLETLIPGTDAGYEDSYSGQRTHAMANGPLGVDPDSDRGQEVIEIFREIADSVVTYEKLMGCNCKDWGKFTLDYHSKGHGISWNYGTADSSVEDADHYGYCYNVTETTEWLDLNQQYSNAELLNARFEVSRADGLHVLDPSNAYVLEDEWSYYYWGPSWTGPLPNGVFVSTPENRTVEKDPTTYINVSGEKFEIPTSEHFYDSDPRYYRVGNLEFFLACLTFHEYPGPYERRFVFIQKNGGESIVEHDVVFSDDDYYHEIPDVKGPDGGALYCSTSFRLIREDTKTMEQ